MILRALTICQPYAFYMTLPVTDPRHKRVENRSWYTRVRGIIAIHAGKSRKWLDTERFPFTEEDLVFGAVVALAHLHAVVNIKRPLPERLSWVTTHPHTYGPQCWVFTEVWPLAEPIPAKGAQGIWEWEFPLASLHLTGENAPRLAEHFS